MTRRSVVNRSLIVEVAKDSDVVKNEILDLFNFIAFINELTECNNDELKCL